MKRIEKFICNTFWCQACHLWWLYFFQLFEAQSLIVRVLWFQLQISINLYLYINEVHLPQTLYFRSYSNVSYCLSYDFLKWIKLVIHHNLFNYSTLYLKINKYKIISNTTMTIKFILVIIWFTHYLLKCVIIINVMTNNSHFQLNIPHILYVPI